MRVLVTGGTGFLGSHTAAALVNAGHDVRLLVRSPERITPALEPLGVTEIDSRVGDVTDPRSVEEALEGSEAVVHAASVFSFDPRRSAEMAEANVRGAEIVLGRAAERGLRPIVHVSTFAALFSSRERPLTPDTEPGRKGRPYARSKAAQELYARALQEKDAPVVIVQPGAVFGPNDPHFGESDRMTQSILTGKMPIVPAGGIPVADVRDVADAIVHVIERTRAPRRYLLGGSYTTLPQLIGLLGELTGRHIRSLPLREELIVPVAYAADALQRVVKSRLPVSRETIWITRARATTDDSRAREELGFVPRDLRETVADTVRSLVASGRLTPRQAGALGTVSS
jgi:dihydroflavonol-4-reductase